MKLSYAIGDHFVNIDVDILPIVHLVKLLVDGPGLQSINQSLNV